MEAFRSYWQQDDTYLRRHRWEKSNPPMNSTAILPALLRYDEMLCQQMKVLDSLGFGRDEVILARLSADPVKERGVQLPSIKVVWTNSQAKRRVSFWVHLGWAISCEVRNTEPGQSRYSNQSFSFLDYLAHVKPEQRGPAWQDGFLVDDGFEAFTARVAGEFNTDLRPVLLGEGWPDVPFDWQGQK